MALPARERAGGVSPRFVAVCLLAPLVLGDARGSLAFRAPAGAPGALAPAVGLQAGAASRGRVFASMPAGVGEARVFAAAAEWLLLHAAPPAPPDAMCAPLQTGAPSGGAKASAGRGDELDLFSLIHKMLWPLANAPLHVQAMGMADLPPEASPMQIYEWLSATDPLVRELHSAEHAMRHAEVVPSDCREVRSGFRGGVEAIRGGGSAQEGELGRRRMLEMQYTRVHRSAYAPLLYKSYRPGAARGTGASGATGCSLGDRSLSPPLLSSSSGFEPQIQYLRGGSGGWGFFLDFWRAGGVQVRRVPGQIPGSVL